MAQVTRLEFRWRGIVLVLCAVAFVVVVARIAGTRAAELLTFALLLGPSLWYLWTSIRSKRKNDDVPPELAYLHGVDVPPSCDVPDAGGCN
jgi:hypothetical protein